MTDVVKQVDDSLQSTIDKVRKSFPYESVAACRGNYDSSSPISIAYRIGDGSLKECQLPANDNDIISLQTACQVATFGLGSEEVRDETYRKALKLDTRDFLTTFDLSRTPILSTVKRILAPDADYITAELYKLNIYKAGGFFKPHRDTPRDSDMFASLVICLPQPFEGGEFVVEHDGKRYEYGDQPDDQAIQWFAFYSDCLHEVHEVKNGTRITLTYNLYRGQYDNQVTELTEYDELYQSMRSLIDYIKAHSKKVMTFGFPLKHMYVDGAKYKGTDLIMFHTLEKLMKEYGGYLSIMPYKIIRDDRDNDDDSFCSAEEPPRDSDAEEVQDEFAYIHWDKFKGAYEVMDEHDYPTRFKYFKASYGAVKFDVQWVAPPKNFCYVDTVPAYGNEPSTENLYCAGCILVHVYPVIESDKSSKN